MAVTTYAHTHTEVVVKSASGLSHNTVFTHTHTLNFRGESLQKGHQNCTRRLEEFQRDLVALVRCHSP